MTKNMNKKKKKLGLIYKCMENLVNKNQEPTNIRKLFLNSLIVEEELKNYVQRRSIVTPNLLKLKNPSPKKQQEKSSNSTGKTSTMELVVGSKLSDWA